MGSVNVEGVIDIGYHINVFCFLMTFLIFCILRCLDILGPGRPWEGLSPLHPQMIADS